jgi:hypothetical protein
MGQKADLVVINAVTAQCGRNPVCSLHPIRVLQAERLISIEGYVHYLTLQFSSISIHANCELLEDLQRRSYTHSYTRPRLDTYQALARQAGQKTTSKGITMAGFDFLTLEDAYQERPPRKYAVHGINEMPSVNILYGTPATMKSMIEADKVHCILNGIPWLQNEHATAINTTRTGVLWIDFDNGKRRTLDRLAAVGRHYGTPRDAPLYIVSCVPEGLNMRDPDSVLRLRESISTDIGYVVVDNLGYVSGGADENSTQMIPVMGAFRTLSEQTGAAFTIIQHERKGSTTSTDRAGDKIRGSTSIEGALDRAFRVTRNEGEDLITIHSVKERDQRIRPISARFHFTHDASNELREAWFTGEDANTIDSRVQKAVLRFVGDEERNQSQIIDTVTAELPVGRPAVIKALNWLEGNKRLITSTGNRGSKLYKKPIDKQLGLDKFEDIVHYNHEIVPTHRTVALYGAFESKEGAA